MDDSTLANGATISYRRNCTRFRVVAFGLDLALSVFIVGCVCLKGSIPYAVATVVKPRPSGRGFIHFGQSTVRFVHCMPGRRRVW
ncbi:MAG TPA: hypothetical protein VK453_03715 [Micromonosporaceae bacterium]|nr:hypothetical protein [Micromonosporaceae bacterium]